MTSLCSWSKLCLSVSCTCRTVWCCSAGLLCSHLYCRGQMIVPTPTTLGSECRTCNYREHWGWIDVIIARPLLPFLRKGLRSGEWIRSDCWRMNMILYSAYTMHLCEKKFNNPRENNCVSWGNFSSIFGAVFVLNYGLQPYLQCFVR